MQLRLLAQKLWENSDEKWILAKILAKGRVFRRPTKLGALRSFKILQFFNQQPFPHSRELPH